MKFEGFPRGVRSVPVPSPIFGSLLEKIDDLCELKCTLRLIWIIQNKKGANRYITEAEIKSDRVLSNSLGNHENIMKSVQMAVDRGTFICFRADENQTPIFALNSETGKSLAGNAHRIKMDNDPEPWHPEVPLSSVYSLYEQNIGVITPIIADKIKESEDLYPTKWIEDAIGESVTNNKRSWSYVSTILENWKTRGRQDGKSTRNTGKTRYR